MGLFDKKFCDVCGEKIGFLGNRKLEDGNLCKNCAKKLSPWFDERRHSTLEQIKQQLAYREANEAEAEKFNVTRTFGENWLLCLDEDNQKFLVARTSDFVGENADVLDLSLVTSCELSPSETRTEEKFKDKDGKLVSFSPPRFRYDYEFYIVIKVNHPWFDEMRFRLNSKTVRVYPLAGSGRQSAEYRAYEQLAKEIKAALITERRKQAAAAPAPAAAAAPAAAVTCPWCGGSTVPDGSGRCSLCNGTLDGTK